MQLAGIDHIDQSWSDAVITIISTSWRDIFFPKLGFLVAAQIKI
jgi:hypothetical protein